MATGNYVLDKGYDAAAAITKFRAVKFSALETVTPVTADTDVVAGIAQVSVTAGEILKGKGVQTRVMGASEMEASAAINPGQLVVITADGRAAPGTAGDRVVGMCVEGCANPGERVRVQLIIPGPIHP